MIDPVSVTVEPHWNFETDIVKTAIGHGFTIDQIVRSALIGITDAELKFVRVAVSSPSGIEFIAFEYWKRVRPNQGVDVVIRITPSKNALRSILSIVVSIGAVALGGIYGAGLGTLLGTSTAIGTALIVTGVGLLGNLLINALIPPTTPDEVANTYSISGFKNRALPNGAVPVVLGKMRIAPPYAALPYTEIDGDDQYIRALFVVGEGQVNIGEMRIGETDLSEFDDVEIETRDGLEEDDPVTLYPTQVVEEQIGVELTRPLPRDDLGEVIDDEDAIETPVVRTTGSNATGASVLLAWPAGLVRYNDDGDKRSRSVKVRIEQRLVEASEWQEVETLKISASKAEGFYRQHTWSFPSRARWQVRCTMMTKESTSSQVQQRTNWASLQTLRPEYPLNYPRPLALVALRIKATHQLSGALDNFSCIATRICADWDTTTQTWITRATENPASLYRHVLQDPALPTPQSDEQIDLDQLQDWHEFCDANSLTFNKPLSETGTTLFEVLNELTAAGRASSRHDGRTYGVVIDRPTSDALIVDHVTPRNAWSFKTTRSYFKPPDASIVTFLDADNDYKETQREIRWPDFEGDIEVTETLPMSGKVYADEVWKEARRRQLEAIHRPDTFNATQDGIIRVATRGDHVMTSHYSISTDQQTARVTTVLGALVELDEWVQMDDGEDYAIRFRWFEDTDDAIGQSVVRMVKSETGDRRVLTLVGTGPVPARDEIVIFGKAVSTARHHIVRNVETTADGASIFTMAAAAPEIDTTLDATETPAWSSIVGAELDDNILQPSAPRFTSLSSGISGTDTEGLITYLISPGSGAIATSSFEIDHRIFGETEWITTSIAAANGGGELTPYNTGDIVEIRACGISPTGVYGPYTNTVTLIVGEGDADIPTALDDDAIMVTTLLGGALIQIVTGEDPATTAVQVYRSTSNVLDRETDAVGHVLSVEPQSSYSTTLGDTTRTNLIVGGTMADASAWAFGGDWVIGNGVAAHTSGSSGALSQSLAATAGKYYRIGFTIDGALAGSLTPRLSGGSDRIGTPVNGNGTTVDRIQAVTGNDTIEFTADAAFDGSLDDLTAYLETDGCLAQGIHYIWIEPQNVDGLNGPVSGPFEINIV